MKSNYSKGYAPVIGVLLFVLLASGMNSLAATETFRLNQIVTFSKSELQFDRMGNYDLIKTADHSYINSPGAPMLPSRTIKIALPDGMQVTSIEVSDVKTEEISGQYNIFPAQPPLEIGQSPDDAVFIDPEPGIYSLSKAYPGKIAVVDRQSDLGGQSYVCITVYPLQYNPADKKLILNSSFRLIINGTDGYRCGDYLPVNASEKLIATYKSRLSTMIVNDGDIQLQAGAGLLKSSGNLPSSTPFDHLIITSVYNAPTYEPLAEWHNKKGVRDTVITFNYIYATYPGADQKEQIRNFIIDAHENWGTMYVLIGGEYSTIPFAYRNYDNENIPSDAYYADYDDDWEYELYVGRSTAEGPEQVTRFVNKVIEYETSPPDLNYTLDITLLGMDLTVGSDPPYYTLTRGQYLKDSIDIYYIPQRFAVTKVYDTDGTNHRDAFLAALNDGQNLVNHNDHANYYVMGTGDRNHGLYISYNDVRYLTNYHKYCNIWSVGCHANRMDVEDAISEHFILDTDTTGAISFTGNTRSGWFYVGDPLSLSSQLDLYSWAAMFDQNIYRLGEILAYSKSIANTDQTWPYSEWTYNLLGEPEMPLWTDFLNYFIVNHDTEIQALPQTFHVHAEKYGGPVENALVCLWKGSDIFARGYTDANGDAYIDISPTTNGALYVTVTKQNFVPYQGQAQITGNVPPVCSTPPDTVIFQCTEEEVVLPVSCFDPDGNLESGPELIRGVGQIIEGYWHYTPSGEDSVSVTVRCTDSLGYFCETEFIVIFDINVPPTCSVPADTSITEIMPATELTLPVTAEDPDQNISECVVWSGPGTLTNGNWIYTPTDDETISVTIRTSDDCGQYTDDSFEIQYIVYACGDADGNNEINILDVTYLISYIYLDGPAPVPSESGDSNGNYAINILDATYLITYLYKNGPPPACP